MANGPERESRKQRVSGYRFKREDSNVRADQQPCEVAP
jgi:hypothetical protein